VSQIYSNGATGVIALSLRGTGACGPIIKLVSDYSSSTWFISQDSAFTVYNINGTGSYLTYGGTAWSTGSDIRLKKNVTTIDTTLDKILALRPVLYQWKAENDGVFHPGFIAQEVETVLPELITEAQNVYLKDNAKGLSMTNFIPYIVKAFQEQNEVVQSQQSQIQELHTKLAAMEARLAAAGF
jgi:hypothetical protein